MKKLAVILIIALMALWGAGLAETSCPEPAPVESAVAANFINGYFQVVAKLEGGSAGYSLKLANAAYEVVRFARESMEALGALDGGTNLKAAWEALDDECRQRFTENIADVVWTADDALRNFEDERPTFEDAGVADEMAALVEDKDSREAFLALVVYTLYLDQGVNDALNTLAYQITTAN